MNNREAFEAWFESQMYESTFQRKADGDYEEGYVDYAWEGYQAALAQANEVKQSQAQQTESKYTKVAHPKLKRDYVGRLVRLTKDVSNGFASIPKSKIGKVTTQSPKGSIVQFEPCKCCGVKAYISNLDASDIEFIEPLPPAPMNEVNKPEGDKP